MILAVWRLGALRVLCCGMARRWQTLAQSCSRDRQQVPQRTVCFVLVECCSSARRARSSTIIDKSRFDFAKLAALNGSKTASANAAQAQKQQRDTSAAAAAAAAAASLGSITPRSRARATAKATAATASAAQAGARYAQHDAGKRAGGAGCSLN